MNKDNDTLANIENMLLGQKKVLNIEEFCRYTGFSKHFAYKLTSQRRIKFYRPGGKLIMLSMDDIQQFLLSNPISPVEDVEQASVDYVVRKSWRGLGK